MSFVFPIQPSIPVTQEGRVEMLDRSVLSVCSQDLEEPWYDAGRYCWARGRVSQPGTALFSAGAPPPFWPMHRVQYIDTEQDWVQAEWLFRTLNAGEGRRR